MSALIFKAKSMNLGGDMKGDGFQNGGALVVSQGGDKVLLKYIQEEAPDHVDNDDVLKVIENAHFLKKMMHVPNYYS